MKSVRFRDKERERERERGREAIICCENKQIREARQQENSKRIRNSVETVKCNLRTIRWSPPALQMKRNLSKGILASHLIANYEIVKSVGTFGSLGRLGNVEILEGREISKKVQKSLEFSYHL